MASRTRCALILLKSAFVFEPMYSNKMYHIHCAPVEPQRKNDASFSGSMQEIAKLWAKKLGPRQRKSRYTVVDGHTVLKQNMYSLEDGEPSVFEREAKTTDPAVLSMNMLVSRTQRAGRDYDHQDFCQICCDGGSLVLCDWCPCAYHLSCLGVTEVSNFNFSCPHHQCKTCGRKAHAVGGLLFRCEVCEAAFCEDDLPQIARDNITNTCQRFVELGQNPPKQACFMLCSESCIKYHAATNGGRDPTAVFATTDTALPNATTPVPKNSECTQVSTAADDSKKLNPSKSQKQKDKGARPTTILSYLGRGSRAQKAARINHVSAAAATSGISPSKPVVLAPTASTIVPKLNSCWERLRFLGFPKSGHQFTEQRLKKLIRIAAESMAEPLTLEEAVPNFASELTADPESEDYLKGILQPLGKPGVPLALWAGPNLSSSRNARDRRDKIAEFVLHAMSTIDSSVSEGGADGVLCMKMASLLFGLPRVKHCIKAKKLSISLFLAFPCPFFGSWTRDAWCEDQPSRRFRTEVRTLCDGITKTRRQFEAAVAKRKHMREIRDQEERARQQRNDSLVHEALELIANMVQLGWKPVIYEAQRGARAGIAQVQLRKESSEMNIDEAVKTQLKQAHEDIVQYFHSEQLKLFVSNAASTMSSETSIPAASATARIRQHLIDYLHSDATDGSTTGYPFPTPDRLKQLRLARFGVFRQSSKSTLQMLSDLGLERQTRKTGNNLEDFADGWKFPTSCLGNAELLRVRDLLIKGSDFSWTDVIYTMQTSFGIPKLLVLGHLIGKFTKAVIYDRKTPLYKTMSKLIHNNRVSSAEREVVIKKLVTFIDKSQIPEMQMSTKGSDRRWRVICMDSTGPSLGFTSREDVVLPPHKFTFTTRLYTTNSHVKVWGKPPEQKPYQYMFPVRSTLPTNVYPRPGLNVVSQVADQPDRVELKKQPNQSDIREHLQFFSSHDSTPKEISPQCVSSVTVQSQIDPQKKRKISDIMVDRTIANTNITKRKA